MKKIVTALLFILFFFNLAHGQYLEVRRSANIRVNPDRDSDVILKVQKGTYLQLLDDGRQKKGYYKVRTNVHGREGWIYRTLVRRYDGNMPSSDESNVFELSFEPAPANYYADTQNLNGEDLKAALNEIIKDHREFSYGAVWDILKETDLDVTDNSRVVGLYSGFSMDADAQYDGGKGWNREHVWAKSNGDFGTSIGAGTDVHHLRAADVSTNSARNNIDPNKSFLG